jgi:hypothetical protein
MMRILFGLAFTVAALSPLYSQITCTVSSGVPPMVRARGAAELVDDLVMTCTSSGPSQSVLVNIQIFLNVNLTSHITNAITHESEGLLLIDEPKPGVPNTSNGFPYFGQVPGTLGVPAGAPGSGNVYQAHTALNNTIVWAGVPYVTGGTRTFRITNIRANVIPFGVSGLVEAFLAIAGPFPVTINPQPTTVAIVAEGLKFSSTLLAGAPGLGLSFSELFPTAFKKRIENTILGPLTASYQDVPGMSYCTESGFTPEFSALTPGAIGSANTGTRLLALLANIPPAITVLVAPNEVTSSSGSLVAHRVLPPFASNFTGGTVLTSPGYSPAFVTATHTAKLLYEVTAAPPFLGTNGCFTLDTFNIPALSLVSVSLASVTANGHLAPVDATPVASPTAPEPRFIP